MNTTSAFVFRCVRTLKSSEPSIARAAIVLGLAVIAVLLAGIALQAEAPGAVIVAPLRWSS